MLARILNKLTDIMQKHGRKKLIENCLIFGIIGIIVVIVGGVFCSGSNSKKKIEEDNKASANILTTSHSNLEQSLELILSKIKGVRKVNVMIAYATGKQLTPAYDEKKNTNETQEKDSTGGVRGINQSSYETKMVYEDEPNGQKKPIIIKETNPEIRGVIIVAQGAEDITVKENLCRAVEAVTNIPIYKIQVFEMNAK